MDAKKPAIYNPSVLDAADSVPVTVGGIRGFLKFNNFSVYRLAKFDPPLTERTTSYPFVIDWLHCLIDSNLFAAFPTSESLTEVISPDPEAWGPYLAKILEAIDFLTPDNDTKERTMEEKKSTSGAKSNGPRKSSGKPGSAST